jgi:CBS domain-containing protein
MKTARQLIERKPGIVSIAPHESVFTALERMAEHDIGALVVLDGPVLAGVLSERDYARKVILLGKSSRDMRVSEIMTHKVVCVGPDQTVDQCMAVMTEKRCRHLPVLEGKRVIGVLSIGDLVKWKISEVEAEADGLKAYIAGS